MWTTNSFGDYTTAKTNHDKAITELGPLKAKVLIATKDKDTAVLANTAKKQEVTDLIAIIGADVSAGEQKAEVDADGLITAPLAAKDAVTL